MGVNEVLRRIFVFNRCFNNLSFNNSDFDFGYDILVFRLLKSGMVKNSFLEFYIYLYI